MEFKDRLKTLRESRKMSQLQLSKALNVSSGLIAHYETGKRKPSRERMEQIADFFNVSMDYLNGRELGSVYYLDPEVAEMAQEIHDNEGLRILFDTTRNVTKEDLQIVIDVAKRIFGNEE